MFLKKKMFREHLRPSVRTVALWDTWLTRLASTGQRCHKAMMQKINCVLKKIPWPKINNYIRNSIFLYKYIKDCCILIYYLMCLYFKEMHCY